IDFMKVRKSIGAIILYKGTFLLLARGMVLTSNGFKKISPEWDLLKGGIDDGESPKDALLRELYEETGSKKYTIIKQFKDKLLHGLPEFTGFDRQEVTMFLVEYVGDGKDLLPDAKEITELKFFDKGEAMRHIKYPETREFFEKNI
ncbi:MAG: NUDIX hydrolase, partial [Candidatus Woesearchaeota archaeon]